MAYPGNFTLARLQMGSRGAKANWCPKGVSVSPLGTGARVAAGGARPMALSLHTVKYRLKPYLTHRIDRFNAFSTPFNAHSTRFNAYSTPFNASLTPGVEFQRRSTPVQRPFNAVQRLSMRFNTREETQFVGLLLYFDPTSRDCCHWSRTSPKPHSEAFSAGESSGTLLPYCFILFFRRCCVWQQSNYVPYPTLADHRFTRRGLRIGEVGGSDGDGRGYQPWR